MTFDAIGVAAVRLDETGNVQAIAAGGLKSFRGGDVAIELARRTDMALWRDAKGQWRGILLGHEGPVPDSLARITDRWDRLRMPEQFKAEQRIIH